MGGRGGGVQLNVTMTLFWKNSLETPPKQARMFQLETSAVPENQLSVQSDGNLGVGKRDGERLRCQCKATKNEVWVRCQCKVTEDRVWLQNLCARI